jgi:hypothetical protein
VTLKYIERREKFGKTFEAAEGFCCVISVTGPKRLLTSTDGMAWYGLDSFGSG